MQKRNILGYLRQGLNPNPRTENVDELTREQLDRIRLSANVHDRGIQLSWQTALSLCDMALASLEAALSKEAAGGEREPHIDCHVCGRALHPRTIICSPCAALATQPKAAAECPICKGKGGWPCDCEASLCLHDNYWVVCKCRRPIHGKADEGGK